MVCTYTMKFLFTNDIVRVNNLPSLSYIALLLISSAVKWLVTSTCNRKDQSSITDMD